MSLLKMPLHPGEVLIELYLKPLMLSPIELAKRLNVPRTRIERLVKGTTSMSPDTALRLAKFFNTTPQYWINLQTSHDIVKVQKKIDLDAIEPIEPHKVA